MAEIADLIILHQLAGSRSDSGESESVSDSGDGTGDPEGEDCWTSCEDADHHHHYHRYQGTNRGHLVPMFSPRSHSDSYYPEVREPPGSVHFRFPDPMADEDLRSDLVLSESGIGLGFRDEDHHDEEKAYWSGDGEGEGSFLEDSVSDCGNEGLRVVEFGSGSDEDGESVELEGASIVQNQWDCLRIDEFEWEEVDDDTNGGEGVGGTLMMYPEEERTNVQELSDQVGEMTADDNNDDVEEEEDDDSVDEEEDDDEEDDDEDVVNRNLEWEVLLSMGNLNLETNDSLDHTDFESYVESGDQDQDDFVYTSEDDEILFGQFADNEISIKGSPPTARSVVDNLPSIVLSQEDVERNNTLCAVCKDEFLLGEGVKQLPCLHHYHADCILPWLGMRNTCPVCRYELPSDDPEYESTRARRANTGLSNGEEYRIGYMFQMVFEE